MGTSGRKTLTRPEGAVDQIELIGELARSLDDRGRLSVPTTFRWAFAEGAVVLRWPGPCVAILPVVEYRKIEESMRVKQREQMGDALARRALNELATHTHLDASGRLFVNEALRAHAGFDRELVVVGQRNRLELWADEQHAEGAEERWQALVAHISAEAL